MRSLICVLFGIGLVSLLSILFSNEPALALAPNCTCPANTSPGGGNSATCYAAGGGTVAATCVGYPQQQQTPGTLIKDIFGIPHTHPETYNEVIRPNATDSFPNTGNVEDDDPYGIIASYRVSPVTSSLGPSPGYQTTSVGTGADAHINAARIVNLNLGSDQRLSLGVYFDYFHDNTTFDATSALFGSAIKQDTYKAGGTVTYDYGLYRLFGKMGGVFGNGAINYSFDGSSGQFNSSGYEGVLGVTRGFTLSDNRIYAATAPGAKSPPSVTGGYMTGLSMTGQIGTYSDQTAAFTDTSGFTRGAEDYTTWQLGLKATLFANVYANGYTWTPFLAASYSDLFIHRDYLAIPFQAAVPTGTNVYFGSPGRNYAGVQGGFNMRAPDGINVGVSGFFSGSSATTGYGGKAYIIFPIMRWLGAS